jgi:Fimbrial assembly protein (PilN)
MSDISFLPSGLKDQEEEIKKQSLKAAPTGVVSMHVPETEEEDVEIIEVDASEVDQILIGEPLYTKLYYKASLFVDSLKEKYLKPRPAEAPAKAPPQFFKPPVKGAATPAKPGEPAKPLVSAAKPGELIKTPIVGAKPGEIAKSKARIRPATTKPTTGRRVRIIKRVRKPVHVSLLDERTMHDLHINIPKRKFTIIFLTLLFAAILGGAFLLLDQVVTQAISEKNIVKNELDKIHTDVKVEQDKWIAFQDLEPRLIALNDLLETHISANKVLKYLEDNTLEDVSYSSFMMSEDGQVNVSVTALNYDAAARQLLTFEQSPLIQAAESNSFSTIEQEGNEYVAFQLTLLLKPEALLFKDIEIKTNTSTRVN